MKSKPISLVLLLQVLLAGCGVEPQPFDGRRANFDVEIYTTFEQLMPAGFTTEPVYVGASYSSPWNPDGGAVPAVVVDINGCGITVNGAAMQDNGENPRSDGYRRYINAEPVLVYQTMGGLSSSLEPVTIAIDLPSEDSYHYPDGYPRLETTLALPDFQFEEWYMGATVAEGDTIRYGWTREPDLLPSWSLENDPDDAHLIRTYRAAGEVVRTDTLWVDATANELEVVVGEFGAGQSNRSLELRFQLTTGTNSTITEVVPGKQASIGLREIREYNRIYAIQ